MTTSTSGAGPEWSYEPSLGPPALSVIPGAGTLFAARYEVLGALGAGAMGVVLRARDRTARREVALKLLTRRTASGLVHFRREGQLLARVEHQNVVRIHDAGVERDAPYLVLELVPGARTLDAHLAPLGPRERVSALAEVADGVGACHALGILHRDLKPQNVLVGDDGRPRVTDFGLAREVEGSRITETGDLLGTPQYMSPEQFFGRPAEVGPPTDVWALGVLLFEALAGEAPFQATTIQALAYLLAEVTPPPVVVAGAPPALAAVVARALAKRPAERHPDARALASDLRAVVAAWGDAPPPARRSLRLPLGAAALALGLAVAVARSAGGPPPVREPQAPPSAPAVAPAGVPSLARAEAALAAGDGQLALALARQLVSDGDPAAVRCLVAAALWLDEEAAAAEALAGAGDAAWALPLRVRLAADAGEDPRGPIPARASGAARREAEAHAALAGGWLQAAAHGLGVPLEQVTPAAALALPLDRDALARGLLAVARRDAAALHRLEPRGLDPAARRARGEAFARAALERSRPGGATARAAAGCLAELARPVERPRRPGRLLVDLVLRNVPKVIARGKGEALAVLRWAARLDPLNPRAAFSRAQLELAVGDLEAALRADPRLHGSALPSFGKHLRGVQGVTSAVLARPDLGRSLEEFEPPDPARMAERAAALEAALRADPGDVLAIGALALLDLRLGRAALARERLAFAAEAEPGWAGPRLYEAIGHMLAQPPDREAARAALREAWRLGWPQPIDGSVYPELAPLLR